MKLSKKGQIKIGESLCIFGRSLAGSRATALAQLAFEPDDFDGVVFLTLDEAKILLTMVDDFPELSVANRLIKRLQERIEQAEMSMPST